MFAELPAFLARQLGMTDAVVQRFDERVVKGAKAGRHYFELSFGSTSYFLKWHAEGAFSSRIYRLHPTADWPVPARIWQGRWQRGTLAVDALVPGQPLVSFHKASDEQLQALAQAMACVNRAAAQQSRWRWRLTWRRSALLHVEAMADRLAAFPDLDADLVAAYRCCEPQLLRWLQQLPVQTLNHQDCKPQNVLWDAGRVWLVDWDSARPGPFGLSLWQLTVLPLPRRRKIVAHYAEALSAAGFDVDVDQMLKRMAVQYLFWSLKRGLTAREPRRLQQALIHFRDEVLESFA